MSILATAPSSSYRDALFLGWKDAFPDFKIARRLRIARILVSAVPLLLIFYGIQRIRPGVRDIESIFWAFLIPTWLTSELMTVAGGIGVWIGFTISKRKYLLPDLLMTGTRPLHIAELILYWVMTTFLMVIGISYAGFIALVAITNSNGVFIVLYGILAVNGALSVIVGAWMMVSFDLAFKNRLHGLWMTMVGGGAIGLPGLLMIFLFAMSFVPFKTLAPSMFPGPGAERLAEAIALLVMPLFCAALVFTFKWVMIRTLMRRLERVIFPRLDF